MNAIVNSFAEMAVELKLADPMRAELSLAEIRFTLGLQTMVEGELSRSSEHLAARIGLSPEISARIAAGRYHHTNALASAHALIKALIPIEAEVMALLAKIKQ